MNAGFCMRKIYFFPFCIIVSILELTNEGFGQTSSTDYFRSFQSGSWDVASSWESSPDGRVNWVPALSIPNSDANTITIRSGHNVTINNSIIADQVVVTSGGVLELATSSSSLLTINDGAGSDIIVQDGGIFKHNIASTSSLPFFNSSTATLEIQGGGVLEAATNNGNASGYANTASTISSNILWDDGAIFNWSNTDNPTAEVTYFPASPAIPIFRFSMPASIGGTSATIINGLLEANAELLLANSGKKIFRNGITGTGKVAVTGVSVGQFVINGTTAILSGTGSLELSDPGLGISPNTTLMLTSNKTVNNYFNGTTLSTGSIKDTGTIIAGNYIINGNSKVQIIGTVKTTNVNGLSGRASTTFAAGFTVNTPGNASTVEYNGIDQIITPLIYNKLIISGAGTKTVAAGSDIYVSDSLNIMPGNTFALNGTDNLKLNGGGILNINANAVFDNGGESEISGGSLPVINISGTFITRDSTGFSGSGASISGTNITLKILDGSTVEYGRAGNQTVTKRGDYKNLTFSGSGIKTIPTCRPIGTVTIKDNVTVDASNKTFGDTNATNLTMTGGRLKVGGTGTKPDIAGTYNLTGGVIEFTTSGKTAGTIRSPLSYLNIEVSGSNVGNSSGITTLKDGGSFTVRTGGVFENSGLRIDGTTGYQTFVMEPGATFITGVTGGFSGTDSSALYNIDNLLIDPKSTIIYNRRGNQTITPLAAYPSLMLKTSGTKTIAGGTITIAAAADSVVIDTTVVFKISSGAKVNFQNRPVIIHSSAGGTGIIGEIADGASALLNASKVTVERFIPKRRAYRFISPSVTTTSSIKANWMEGGVNANIYPPFDNPHPGFGTNITGRNPRANGFDITKTTNPSLYQFNTAKQTWDTVPNTNSSLAAGDAYSILVRGDRSTDMSTNTPDTTNTILRATGTLYAGTYLPAVSSKEGNYSFIGNPYASSVDFEKMLTSAANVSPSYYVWDPHFGSHGIYVSYNATEHKNSLPGKSEVDKNIQPGQAVFVRTVLNASASIPFQENYKSTVNTKVFRDPSEITDLSVQLLLNLNEGLENIADGAVSYFNSDFSTAIGDEDSYKFTNSEENLAIGRNDTSLSIEGRLPVTCDDSMPLKIWQLNFKQKNYYLKVTGSNFFPGVKVFLKDNYLHKETPVDLLSPTAFSFSIDTAITASYAIDRFSILFTANSNSILPVTLIGVKAYQKEQGVQVNWTVNTEINTDRYEVEQSVNGQTFTFSASVPVGNNNAVKKYSWFNATANPGNNFYRIKIIEKSGAVKYSETINVKVNNLSAGITVSPNPVKTNVITLHFSNIKKGRYTVNIYNSLGQKIYNSLIEHTDLSGVYALEPLRKIPKGVYRLAISKEDKTITKTLVFE